MKTTFTALFFWVLYVSCPAQVKSNYQYSTTMPYGTLDIRTNISSTNYYYLQEGKTFSYRESSPGVRTNSYLDKTTFDSSPYEQGHLRQKNGTADLFKMNYRLLKPVNYNATYAEGYPMIVIMHGAAERGNCYYNNCYHGGWTYDPNVNSPAAPKTATHQLLNNDHNLQIGGKQHLDARNLAGTRLPNDPSMPTRAFPGFVVVPQMFNEWHVASVEDMVRIVRLLTKKYKIDQNRIYIHGLSIGGYAVWEALKRASWLFAGALPMSATTEAAGIFTHNQQGKVVHVPLWVFQGGTDKNPTPTATRSIISKLQAAGGTPRYYEYPTLAHNVWSKAYTEPDFFTWMLTKSKANLHLYKGNKVIVKAQSIYPKMMLAEGFLAYQWQKNGVTISGATSNTYTATTVGTYRARFSRVSSTPTSESQWNKWSATVSITEGTAVTPASEEEIMVVDDIFAEEMTINVYPNPSRGDALTLQMENAADRSVEVRLVDPLGRQFFDRIYSPEELQQEQRLDFAPMLSKGMYIMLINDGNRIRQEKIIVD